MKRLLVLACLGLIVGADVAVLNPRGNRPVEPGTRSEKCATQKEWPFCSDDDWGSKCPSGCRIQGLMDKNDHSLVKRIEKIRNILDQNRVRHRSTDQVSKQTHDYLKDKLLVDADNDNNYYGLAQNLRQRITDMKIKIDRQLRILAALKDRVKDQVVEMQRLEVDIDIKIRACKGSCSSLTDYEVDRDSYVALDKQIDQLDSQSSQSAESVRTLHVMKSRPLRDTVVDTIYKSGAGSKTAGQQTEDLFPEVKTVQLVLEEEGSKTSPATVSKDSVCARLTRQNQDGRQPSPGHRRRHGEQPCRAKSPFGLCSDDDWVSKCPSGCRLQGSISHVEDKVETRLSKVCEATRTFEDAAEKSMTAMTHIYNANRRVIVNRYVSELKFVEDAQALAKNLTSLRKHSAALSQRLHELRSNVQKQVEDLYRTEVDVDMNLRACRGSCRSALPFTVGHRGYQALHSDMDNHFHQAVTRRSKTSTPPEDIAHIALRSVDVGPVPSTQYKTIPTVQRELLTQFEDIGQNQLVVEEETEGL